jgi:ribosomal-protein-alanine N-acetyltransferase
MDVSLRVLEPADLPIVAAWRLDREFCRWQGWRQDHTESEIVDHFSQVMLDPPDGFIRLGVVADDALVGYAELSGIDDVHAELGFGIGDSARWGQGLGSATARAMVGYAFDVVALRHVWAETDPTNVRSQRVLLRAGFRSVTDGEIAWADCSPGLMQFVVDSTDSENRTSLFSPKGPFPDEAAVQRDL